MHEWRCPICGRVLRASSRRSLEQMVYEHRRREVERSGLFRKEREGRLTVYVEVATGARYYGPSVAFERLLELRRREQ